VLAKTLMAFEATKPDGIAGENDLRGYNKILSEFNNVLERSAASAEESVKSLKFRPYLFDYGSVGRSSIKLRALARKVLEEQRKLVGTLLKDGDDNPNWITQRGITAFWLAVVDLDDAQEGGQKDADRLNSRGNDYLDSAIEDFSTLVKSAKSDPDLSYLLAEALRWRSGRFKNGRREYEANLLAKRAYETAISAFENGRWNPPRDIGAGLYSEYADVLLLGSRGITILLDERNDDWNAEDREVLDAFWGSLYNAQQWEQARRKADATPGSSEWGRRVNAGPGFALGMLGGHLKLFGSVGHTSVNECDRLASSFADPLRRWRSTEFKQIDRDKAKGQCLNAVKMNDGDPHYKYLASRITWEMSFAIDAANGGYPAALNQVRFILETLPRYKSEDSRGRLHLLKESLERAYNQRILLSVFSTVYDFLKDKARDENERNSLKWIAAQAANAGVPAGHIALADLADSDTQRYFHLRIGAELMQKQSLGNATSESEIRSRLDRLQLSTDDLERLNRDIKSWVAPDSPVDVSTLLKELQAALN
jgi:hypothetical protein